MHIQEHETIEGQELKEEEEPDANAIHLRNTRAELTDDAIRHAYICCPATATTLILAGIKVLNHVINAAILGFVLSTAHSDLYICSRTMYPLAIEG